jgi:hypothetical protein
MAAALTTLLLLGCDNSCELDSDLHLFAGDGARDCGIVELGGDPSEVDACVVEAFEAERAFIARYQVQGTDSKVVTALASNTVGDVKLFQWDSAPCGGPGCDPVTDVQSCFEPSLTLVSEENPNALPISCERHGVPERICG